MSACTVGVRSSAMPITPSGCCAYTGPPGKKQGTGEPCSPAPHASRPVFWGGRLVEVALVSDANKIGCEAGAAASPVFCDLGEEAERPGHLNRGRRVIDEFG